MLVPAVLALLHEEPFSGVPFALQPLLREGSSRGDHLSLTHRGCLCLVPRWST